MFMLQFYPGAALTCYWGHSQNICKKLHRVCVCVCVCAHAHACMSACLCACTYDGHWMEFLEILLWVLLKSVDQIQV